MDLIAFPAVLIAGMWLGDYLGRKYQTQWRLIRIGLKAKGAELRDRADRE